MRSGRGKDRISYRGTEVRAKTGSLLTKIGEPSQPIVPLIQMAASATGCFLLPCPVSAMANVVRVRQIGQDRTAQRHHVQIAGLVIEHLAVGRQQDRIRHA